MPSDLPYASFHHPDGSWYRLWITHTTPKTARGHAWHLHASYDKTGTVAPLAGTLWWELPYGMSNWDFDSEAETLAAFRDRAGERLHKGYVMREGNSPAELVHSALTEPETHG
ncbi:hypothetical protein [Deinococcus peraridilitoris]|uniref:WGR domain-containing protein n=1 Tax=Deinococcus peraridilitoris (strain DSM 19664 / LMG 22246 / CIP 109416 / KR-200) TaxID=937777 RepID=L0A475_DEIPD|nr:hypothetical protein [Deinococcus peraridilitoris]AFZ68636.1 hypothetical protein Deipe_3193 [Deinococcus peraridilitoris DSM 19664]